MAAIENSNIPIVLRSICHRELWVSMGFTLFPGTSWIAQRELGMPIWRFARLSGPFDDRLMFSCQLLAQWLLTGLCSLQ